MWLDSYYVRNAFSTHEQISNQTKQKSYTIPPPFTFYALKVLLRKPQKEASHLQTDFNFWPTKTSEKESNIST